MTRLSLLLALSAVVALGAHAVRPLDLGLHGLAADAPAWLDPLVERAD